MCPSGRLHDSFWKAYPVAMKFSTQRYLINISVEFEYESNSSRIHWISGSSILIFYRIVCKYSFVRIFANQIFCETRTKMKCWSLKVEIGPRPGSSSSPTDVTDTWENAWSQTWRTSNRDRQVLWASQTVTDAYSMTSYNGSPHLFNNPVYSEIQCNEWPRVVDVHWKKQLFRVSHFNPAGIALTSFCHSYHNTSTIIYYSIKNFIGYDMILSFRSKYTAFKIS